jgi:hypothetical protein
MASSNYIDSSPSHRDLTGFQSYPSPSYQSAEKMFFWNRFMLSSDFSELASPWTLVLIRGFIGISEHQHNVYGVWEYFSIGFLTRSLALADVRASRLPTASSQGAPA